MLANLCHAVEYGRNFATPAQGRYCVFGRYAVPPPLYSLAFGGILPLVSLMFARILANTAETEAGANSELTRAKQNIRKLRLDLEAAELCVTETEARANAAERRFGISRACRLCLFFGC